jgi:hypothetical protein
MNRENEALWIAVYAASCADTEGLTDVQLADIAEKRANEAILRFGKRFAEHAPVRTPSPEPVESPEVYVQPKSHNGTQRHARS